jgi:hypothetical protein
VNEAHAPKFGKGFMFEIRARFDDSVIRVYQAFSPEVALPALVAGRFVPPFKMSRMTWIKPSFNWMMYRSGFASKPGQEYVLGIDIRREGFEWALEHGVLSAFVPELHGSEKHWERLCCNSSVRIQWDPERTWDLRKVHDQKTIQIGLTGPAINKYVNEWIVSIENVTPIAESIARFVSRGVPPFKRPDQEEKTYPATSRLVRKLVVYSAGGNNCVHYL